MPQNDESEQLGLQRGSEPLRRRVACFAGVFSLMGALSACTQSGHEVVPANRGAQMRAPASDASPRLNTWANFVDGLNEPGPIQFEKHVAADWAVPLSGLLNLKHERAKEARLKNRTEAIQIFFYVLEHPDHGAFMVDSGVARSVAERSKNMPLKWPVTSAMPMEDMRVRLDTRTYLESRNTPLKGVFLTHLHLDHILGLQDVPKHIPIFVGPGETKDKRFTHLFVRSTTKLNLKGFGPLRRWQVSAHDGDAPLAYVDIFGDQSVMGLHIPGHTMGNMAFVVRSTEGPQLLVGDGCHTKWGWLNDVEPGTYNTDGDEAARSLEHLRALAHAHPKMQIHLGHQEI